MKKQSSITAHAILTLVWILVAIYLALIYAPNEASQGNVYRIMYVHVPMGWSAFLAYGLVFIGSVGFIWKRSPVADDLAYA
ncbi:MAG: cytochrome c biogenesis protein CcsA, partial [Terriglobia bacterium]